MACSRPCPCRDDPDRPRWRLALAGVLVVAVFGTGLAAILVNAAILAMIIADLILAASIATLRLSRSGDAKIHLGQSGTTTLTVVNSGSRRLRGVIRDGWQPSAAARPGRARIAMSPGCARPWRRP